MADQAEALRDVDVAEDAQPDKNALKEQKKAERQAKKDAKKAEKLAKKQEKKQSRRGGVAVLAVLFLLIIASGVFLYFSLINDWGGVRTSVLTFVNKLDPSFHTVQAQKIEQYNTDRAALESAQAALAAERKEFESFRAQQSSELDRRKAEIDALEVYVQPLYRQGLSEEKVAEIQKASDMYAGMDAKTAANILSRLSDDTHVAAILFYMDSSVAAEILSNMSADLAARVTTILIKD